MNKYTNRPAVTIRNLFLALSLAAISQALYANEGSHEGKRAGSASAAEVSYVGQWEGQPQFNVLYNNTSGARFSVTLQDEQGNLLYQGTFNDLKFNKTFRMANPESYNKLVITIRSFSDNSRQSFEVRNDSRMTEEVVAREVR